MFQRVDSSAARIAWRSRASRFRVSRPAPAKLAPETAALEGTRQHREESLGHEVAGRLEVVPGAGAEHLEPLGPPAGLGHGHDRHVRPAARELGDEGRPLAVPRAEAHQDGLGVTGPDDLQRVNRGAGKPQLIGVSLEGLADTPNQRLVRIHEQDADPRHGRLYKSVT